MHAFRLETIGDAPRLCTIDRPVPGNDQVLLRIMACGLNFADLLMIRGQYQERPALPCTLGMELAGVVEAVGPGVDRIACGDRVAVFAGQGGLAEWGCFDASACTRIPDTMRFEEAAAFQVAYGTSHLALDHRARLQPQETLLVMGAAGGVGLTAVEIGKRMGARVIATARGSEKLRIAQAAGADHTIDSDAPALRETLRSLGGVDVVYDAVGGPAFFEAMRATNPEGRLIPIGFAGGDVPQIPANHLLVKNLSVIGLYWGGYLKFAPETLARSMAILFDWYTGGGLHPHVSHIFPLDRAQEALDLLRDRKSTGKIVVTPHHL
ncbi:NADPH:quinone oxidoreductase family protein [Pseudorhodobacter sp.]|uniref:NADPH:quinone oxidoreductase family protein n=1 Tax=Pseudorhodobacter sp. TaxID=1934400 RepID=UPI0039E5AFCB